MHEPFERDDQEQEHREDWLAAPRLTARHRPIGPGELADPIEHAALDAVFVVVETDEREQHYDDRLAHLLRTSEDEQRARRRLPFPRTHRIPDEVLRRDYVRTRVRPTDNPNWHFRAWLPRTARAVQSATAGVHDVAEAEAEAKAKTATRTTLVLDGPHTTIDVLTLELHTREDLADWLDEWLTQLGLTPASSRPRHTRHGVMGDVLATRIEDANETVLRYTTVQEGTRVFVIVLRTPLAHYPLIARDYVLFATTFQPLTLG